jgi:hypothetical protein
MARPTLLTPDRAERIEQAVAAGNTVAASAAAVSITETTIINWMDRGRKERARLAQLPEGDDPDPTTGEREGLYLAFLGRIEAARAAAEVQAVAIIRKAMSGWTETTTVEEQRVGKDGKVETVTKTTTAHKFSWSAAAWWLERTRPAQYGRYTRTEVTGADGAPLIPADVEDLRARARQLVEDELGVRRAQRGITGPQSDTNGADGGITGVASNGHAADG